MAQRLFLQPGDRLIAIAPSGALRQTEAIGHGLQIWRDRGYGVDLVSGYDRGWGYLAGTDAQRRQQLQAAIAAGQYQGILAVRGGWGAARLLEDWHWPQWAENLSYPQFLLGFSDITALLWSLVPGPHPPAPSPRTGEGEPLAPVFSSSPSPPERGVGVREFLPLQGLHGPVLTTLAQEPDWSLDRLFNYLQGQPLAPLHGKGWGGGTVTGRLLPGNLTVATRLLGTAVQPDLKGVILALEDVGEVPYRLDRDLTQWRMMGLLQQVGGVALGRFSRCDPPAEVPSLTLEQVLRDRLGDLGIP
ncbi:MAG: S66 peptidase family protein, partial [Prochlorothrix sp.]